MSLLKRVLEDAPVFYGEVCMYLKMNTAFYIGHFLPL